MNRLNVHTFSFDIQCLPNMKTTAQYSYLKYWQKCLEPNANFNWTHREFDINVNKQSAIINFSLVRLYTVCFELLFCSNTEKKNTNTNFEHMILVCCFNDSRDLMCFWNIHRILFRLLKYSSFSIRLNSILFRKHLSRAVPFHAVPCRYALHFDNKRLLVICWDYICCVRLTSNAINFPFK